MTGNARRPGFASRPSDPDGWVRAPEPVASRKVAGEQNDARLTIDVTRSLRRRLKLAAVQRGITLADLVRELLIREFPLTAEEERR